MTAEDVKKELSKYADKNKALFLQRFFKTGKGEYAEGDILIGVTVPMQRATAKKYQSLSLNEIIKLIHSKVHEERLTGLIILTHAYKNGDEKTKRKIFNLYLRNTKWINNWDLVDLTAYKIVGHFLFDKKRDILYKLAKSKLLWDRRISIIATYYFIKKEELDDTFSLAEILLNNIEDLMHKAVGWMLREAGKVDMIRLEVFLKEHYSKFPRTALRYAIEKFPEQKRIKYLQGNFN